MGKTRIHELSRELNIASGDLLERLKADGFDVKTASSSVDDDVAQKYRDKLRGAAAPGPAKAAEKPKGIGLAAAKKLPPGKHEPALLQLPPAEPIPRVAKAVKPVRPKDMTADATAAVEDRRRLRAARLRGEIAPTSLHGEDVSVPDAAPDGLVASAVELDASDAAFLDDMTAEPAPVPSSPDVAAEVHATPAEPTQGHAPDEAVEVAMATAVSEPSAPHVPTPAAPHVPPVAPGPQGPPAVASGLTLPRLVEAAPPRREEPRPAAPVPAPPGIPMHAAPAGPPTTGGSLHLPRLVQPAPPAHPPSSQPPMLPQRPIREFRGPIRKIDLPPQQTRAPSRGPASLSTPSHVRPGMGGGGGPQPQMVAGPQGVTRTFSTKPGTGLGKSKRKQREQRPEPVAPVVAIKKGDGRTLRLTEGVSVKELAEKMDVKAKDIIRLLMMRGVLVTVNVALEPDLAKTIATEFGFAPEVVSFEEDLRAVEEEEIFETESFEGEEEARPPVVTVMGHVDHGKTSLLDAIRKTKVAAGEAGGITQSIGAYQVEIKGRKITFIDTPGHEAFTSMRARGAQITDLVVLVIAATDSVMPQTIEAINHAKAANVPVIVAINKIDLPNARVDKTKTDLMSHGIVPEDFGGDTVTIGVSARTGENVQQLLELILLTTDMRNLKSSVKRRAQGTVIEAGIDRGMGPFANLIVQEGTLRPGDSIIVGAEYGRVRALLDDRGVRMEIAGPSTPVRVTGIQGVPNAGDRLQVVENEERAREISEFRLHKRREMELAKSGARGTLLDLSKAIAEGETKELGIVIKADVHGAVEVLTKSLGDLSTSKVKTKIIHASTGAITDSDILLASASRAVVVGFNVRPQRGAAELAEREKVVVRLHTIIYELINEMKLTMAGLLDSVKEEEFLGRAEVRQIFKVSRVGTVAGCMVQDGKLVRTADVRLVRDGSIVWTGRLGTLKRFKDDAREVAAGFDCGLSLDGFNDLKVGDSVEAFTVKETRPTSLD